MSKVTFSVEEEVIVNALDAFINQGGIRDLIKDMFNQWFTNKDTTKDTDLDLKGYVSCRVTGLGAYTDYSPIKVEVPTYNESGAIAVISTGLDYDEFIWLEEDKTILAEF